MKNKICIWICNKLDELGDYAFEKGIWYSYCGNSLKAIKWFDVSTKSNLLSDAILKKL